MPTDSAKTLDSLLTAEIIGASSPQHMSHNANSITRFSWDNRATRSTERGAKKTRLIQQMPFIFDLFLFPSFFFLQCFALDIPAFVRIRLSFHQWSPAGGAPGGLAEFLYLISFLMWTDLGIRDFGGGGFKPSVTCAGQGGRRESTQGNKYQPISTRRGTTLATTLSKQVQK